jgi:hypothetical protein
VISGVANIGFRTIPEPVHFSKQGTRMSAVPREVGDLILQRPTV